MEEARLDYRSHVIGCKRIVTKQQLRPVMHPKASPGHLLSSGTPLPELPTGGHPGGVAARDGFGRAERLEDAAYLTVTVAPAPSRAALAFSAASLLTFSSSGFGAPSTRSLASLRPRLVSARTSLMTWIFFSPAASRMTSNSSFSSSGSAAAWPPPAPGAAAIATGAAAVTS